MNKLKTSWYWFALFALCFVAFQQVQDNIRPNYSGGNRIITYFLGVAPNFFPGIGLPALFVMLIPQVFSTKNTNKWLNEKKHITANVFSVAGLVSWELLQFTGKLKFDWNDILWTIIGAMIFQCIWTVSPPAYKKGKN
ncbi:hypothetical protein CHU92_13780 [Flavobacterium cyanobacteriorum]|uniref:VanZ-like domain-containing protein n=1 Tax=Flavobacterium cyanobacteriorum TaxID=2022802 RepID=A0A255YUT1_9FLAO|nr:hypothetical protein [Flavobacterium cyanobacteriorum]OYQ32987.1 hypothetical protein CHU92_13780 [Flavobacterium cyanobacteriorum]